jgi:hypothetical protein
MRKRLALAVGLAALSAVALAKGPGDRSDDRWNVTGPNWYETKCGQVGFSATHGLRSTGTPVKPCSVPVRVCEYKRLTISYIADPDRPCEQMVRPEPEGGLLRTYLKTWD